MNDNLIQDIPVSYASLQAKCEEIGFTMPSDLYIGTLLKTLISSKPAGHFLELGTGIGLSLAWMIEGMDQKSTMISVDNDPQLVEIVKDILVKDQRLDVVCQDGAEWIRNYSGSKFDLVFADAWPGKYSDLDAVIALIKVGGLYIIDDMDEQPNWPEGHAEKALKFVETLENRSDLVLTKMNWSTGVIVCTKIA